MDRIPEHPDMARVLIRKYEEEAGTLARRSHPHVVRVHKLGRDGDLSHLVMEYMVEGRALRDEMDRLAVRGERMPRAVVHRVRARVLHGLEVAHALDIVHRNIQWNHVMVQTILGDPWFVRVFDSGLTRFLGSGQETSRLPGMPTCMDPRQIAREGIGPWKDLHAVGALAFEMITGRRPFQGETTQEILAKKLDPDHDPAAPDLVPDMPDVTERFLRRALHRVPGGDSEKSRSSRGLCRRSPRVRKVWRSSE